MTSNMKIILQKLTGKVSINPTSVLNSSTVTVEMPSTTILISPTNSLNAKSMTTVSEPVTVMSLPDINQTSGKLAVTLDPPLFVSSAASRTVSRRPSGHTGAVKYKGTSILGPVKIFCAYN